MPPKRARTLGAYKRPQPYAKRVRVVRRPPRRSYAARLGRRTSYAAFRTQFLKTVETKYVTTSYENINCNHNVGQYIQNLLTSSQGNTQFTRIGDKVHGVGLSVKLWLSNKLDRPNVQWRLIMFTYPDNWSSGTTIFDTYTIGNRMMSNVDTDKYKIVKNTTLKALPGDYSLETGATNKEHSRQVQWWIPLNRSITYKSDGGTEPTYTRDRLAMAIIPYDSFGTLISDNIASFAAQIRFYFKDP